MEYCDCVHVENTERLLQVDQKSLFLCNRKWKELIFYMPGGCILLQSPRWKRGDVTFPISWVQTGLRTPWARSSRQPEDGHFFLLAPLGNERGFTTAIFLGKKKLFPHRKNSWGIAWVTFIFFFFFFLLKIVISVSLSCFVLWIASILNTRD